MVIVGMPLWCRLAEIGCVFILTLPFLLLSVRRLRLGDRNYLWLAALIAGAGSLLFYGLSKSEPPIEWNTIEPKTGDDIVAGLIPMVSDMLGILVYIILIGNLVLLAGSIARALFNRLREQESKPQKGAGA